MHGGGLQCRRAARRARDAARAGVRGACAAPREERAYASRSVHAQALPVRAASPSRRRRGARRRRSARAASGRRPALSSARSECPRFLQCPQAARRQPRPEAARSPRLAPWLMFFCEARLPARRRARAGRARPPQSCARLREARAGYVVVGAPGAARRRGRQRRRRAFRCRNAIVRRMRLLFLRGAALSCVHLRVSCLLWSERLGQWAPTGNALVGTTFSSKRCEWIQRLCHDSGLYFPGVLQRTETGDVGRFLERQAPCTLRSVSSLARAFIRLGLTELPVGCAPAL